MRDNEYYAYVSRDDGTFGLSMTDPFIADTRTYSCKVINAFGKAASHDQPEVNGSYIKFAMFTLHKNVLFNGFQYEIYRYIKITI